MKNLDSFKKPSEKLGETKTRSVLIKKEHAEFLDLNSLNLSALVRDLIDRLIRELPKKKD